jgi:transposase-like protein
MIEQVLNSVTKTEKPDPEVVPKAKRRTFSAEYKLRILREADPCIQPGEIGSLLRREGLYSSNLSKWRQQRRDGTLAGRRPKAERSDPFTRPSTRLRTSSLRNWRSQRHYTKFRTGLSHRC